MKKEFDYWLCSRPFQKKLLMELKIALVITLVSVSNVFAISTYSQEAKISLDLKDKSLEQAMDEIEEQSEFYFIFNQKQINVNRLVEIHEQTKLITEILPELFKGTNINYAIFDRKILLTTEPLQTNPNDLSGATKLLQHQITGIVTDESGNPMTGVTIAIEGSNIGSITDVSGNYSISAPDANSVLVFSFVGYVTQKIPSGENPFWMLFWFWT